MADNDKALAAMRFCNPAYRIDRTLRKFGKCLGAALAVGIAGMRVARLPLCVSFWKMRRQFVVQQAFECPEASLAQRRVGMQRQTMNFSHRARGAGGAAQVGADDHVHFFVGQRTRQCRGLALAFLVKRNIEVALQPALGVPRGFAMSDQKYFGHCIVFQELSDAAVFGLVCNQKVTGPSLVRLTFMSAPKRPVSTVPCCRRACSTK